MAKNGMQTQAQHSRPTVGKTISTRTQRRPVAAEPAHTITKSCKGCRRPGALRPIDRAAQMKRLPGMAERAGDELRRSRCFRQAWSRSARPLCRVVERVACADVSRHVWMCTVGSIPCGVRCQVSRTDGRERVGDRLLLLQGLGRPRAGRDGCSAACSRPREAGTALSCRERRQTGRHARRLVVAQGGSVRRLSSPCVSGTSGRLRQSVCAVYV
jgi:hypothetical protein